jgi:ribosomal protein S12 methylthiotransferase accessory factor YcaO
MRPVPLAPLAIRTEVKREGRKIQLCAVTLRADDVVVVAASAMRVVVAADFCNGTAPSLDFR